MRVSRLVTAVVLARWLDPTDYGLAALAMTTTELVRVLTNNGVGQRIIQASDEDLESVTNRAWRLNWMYCGGLFVLQAMVAPFVGWFYDDVGLAWMVASLGVVYLMMPLGLVHCFLLMRRHQIRTTALVAGGQVTADNLLTAVLAVCGLGPWAIVLPKILVAPLWVIGMRWPVRWRPTTGEMASLRGFLTFGRAILTIELLAVARLHLDKFVIGTVLGVDVLGLYAFAFNAGLGLSLSFVGALKTVLFPHLTETARDIEGLRRRVIDALRLLALVAVPVVLLQAMLAPFYVPIVFGDRWEPVVTVLMLLCLSALTQPFAEVASQAWRALDRPGIDLRYTAISTTAAFIGLALGLPHGLIGVAWAALIVQLIVPTLYVFWTLRTFKALSTLHLKECAA